MVIEGDTVADFELCGAHGDEIATHCLSDYTNDGIVLLSFYPFDFSPVCTRQMCGLRDTEWFEFTDGLSVLGISGDGPYAHRAFASEYEIDFPLLSDTDRTVSRDFDVLYDTFEGCRDIPRRSTFIVDQSRTVQFAWHADDTTVEPDLERIRVAVENA